MKQEALTSIQSVSQSSSRNRTTVCVHFRIPELSTEWWNEIGKIYPEFRKEVEKETDDIGPTLQ